MQNTTASEDVSGQPDDYIPQHYSDGHIGIRFRAYNPRHVQAMRLRVIAELLKRRRSS
jgi:hypothetical protein